MPGTTRIFFEVPLNDHLGEWIAAVADVGGFAKVRTGGTVPEAIPSARDVVRFLSCCVEHRIACKATAGLHHAFRAFHSLTGDARGEKAVMHGFVNVMLAAACLFQRRDPELAVALLEDEISSNFQITGAGLQWRDEAFGVETLETVRREFFLSFGSCSFTEPVGDLKWMGWL